MALILGSSLEWDTPRKVESEQKGRLRREPWDTQAEGPPGSGLMQDLRARWKISNTAKRARDSRAKKGPSVAG